MKTATFILATLIFSLLCLTPAFSDDQLRFDTPEAGLHQLCVAVKNQNRACLERIFGPDTDELLFSGDEVQDRAASKKFREHFFAKHSLKSEGENRRIVLVGDEDWPFPIPLVSTKSGWKFDTEAGKEEIVNRRIGRNELDAIETAKTIVEAQKEYYQRQPNGKAEYAEKVLSTHGKKDGLFWPREANEKPSPLGPLVATAIAEGYHESEDGGRNPFHGYYFKFLPAKKNGFALLAYPASYGNSGIMTFFTDQSGKVLERDLGEATEHRAEAIKEFKAGPEWKQSEG